MKAIGHLYLIWRKGKGSRRIPVGVIRRNSTEGIRFNYLKDGIEKAVPEGFVSYTDFPDLTKMYKENVIDIFGQRLNKPERSDIQKYYDFWDVNPKYQYDKYYLLAHTQGLLATDNFEFLADYYPIKGLSFISEICGLSTNEIDSNLISEGEELRWEFDSKNIYDKNAVKIFKGKIYLGNVKLIHCNVFHKHGGDKLRVRVKSIDKNGHLNRAFITIYMP